jgi:hypothetical protein
MNAHVLATPRTAVSNSQPLRIRPLNSRRAQTLLFRARMLAVEDVGNVYALSSNCNTTTMSTYREPVRCSSAVASHATQLISNTLRMSTAQPELNRCCSAENCPGHASFNGLLLCILRSPAEQH